MQKPLLRTIVGGYVTWLEHQLPAIGKPSLHDFEARAAVLIDALPTDGGPPGVTGLDQASVESAFDWLFKSLSAAYSDQPWTPVACQVMHLLARQGMPEILVHLKPMTEEMKKEGQP